MPQLTFRTQVGCWVIPEHVEFVKLMISQQKISACDLCFTSEKECQFMAKKLSLLALEDECKYQRPSIIAELSRYLVAKISNTN